MRWQPIETAPEFVTVLTQHVDDLYPVPAFKINASPLDTEYWARETEGPEDLDPPLAGKFEQLFRTPTHWMPLPEPPLGVENITNS